MRARKMLEPISYEAALVHAREEMVAGDAPLIARRADVPLTERGLVVPFLGDEYLVEITTGRVFQGEEEAVAFMGVLVLHYLLRCGDGRPSGRFVTFREIPGGEMYYSAFKARAIDRIAMEFGAGSENLIVAGRHLNARELAMGDASIELRPFPKIVLAVVVWEGDEEIPPSANILFDSLALEILPMEDLSVVGNLVASRLIKKLKGLETPPEERPEVRGRG